MTSLWIAWTVALFHSNSFRVSLDLGWFLKSMSRAGAVFLRCKSFLKTVFVWESGLHDKLEWAWALQFGSSFDGFSIKKVSGWWGYYSLHCKGRSMVWCYDLNEKFLIVSGCSQSQFCPSDYQNNLVLSPSHLPVPPFTFLILQKSGFHLSVKKEAWTRCKGASSQAGQKKSALAECPCLAPVKTSIWKSKENEECSVWEDWYMV